MSVDDVIEIKSGLSEAGVTVWVDGGWRVGALVGRKLREHNDLDIAISRQDEKALQDWLAAQGYTERPSPDKSAHALADKFGYGIPATHRLGGI